MKKATIILMTIALLLSLSQIVSAYDMLSELLGGGSFTEVVSMGDYAYCAATRSVTIWDISNPMAPSVVAVEPTFGTCTGLAVMGDYILGGCSGTEWTSP